MNNIITRNATLLLLCLFAANSLATNGMLPHGTGTKSKGLAGAGIALPQDSMITSQNPAGSVWVGQRYDIGFELFMPYREITEFSSASGEAGGFISEGNYESDSNLFLIPHGSVNWRIDNDKSFAIAVYGAGGMNTDYPVSPWNGGTESTGIDLKQLFITPTYSFRVNDKTSFGLSAMVAIQGFEAKGLQPFAPHTVSGSPTYLTNNGVDMSYGIGARVGFQTIVSPKLTLAGSYTSKISMSKFDDYKDLFPNGGELDLPANFTLGLAYKVSKTSTLVFDIQHIQYSDIDAIGTSINNLASCTSLNPPGAGNSQSCFGGSNGPGFGWNDMTVYKIGYQWKGKKGWTWRAGYSYGENPVDETQLNVLAPGVVESHFTFGFTKKTGPDSELSFAAMYAPENSVRAISPLAVVGDRDDIELKMHQFDLELSWSKRFD